MDLSIITKNILLNVKNELKKEENIIILKNDLLKPLIEYTISEIYPYVFKCVLLIVSIIFFMIIIIFLNVKIMLKGQ